MAGKQKSRNQYLDFLKAIAIILVIIGHSIQCGSGSAYLEDTTFYDNPVFKVICGFHMPLFMLISGYLFAHSIQTRHWSSVILQRCRALLIPICAWSLLQPLSTIIIHLNQAQSLSIPVLAKQYISEVLWSQWFLWAVLWCSACVSIVHRFFKDNIWVYLAGFVATFFVPDFLNLHLYKFMYPYFILGYLYSSKGIQLHRNAKLRISMIPIFGGLFAILMLFFTRDSYIYTSMFFILRGEPIRQLGINLYRFITGLAGSLFFISALYTVYRICPATPRRCLAAIGKETMGIYIIQGFLFVDILPRITANLSGVNYAISLAESAADKSDSAYSRFELYTSWDKS